jgi:hypothetical protein
MHTAAAVAVVSSNHLSTSAVLSQEMLLLLQAPALMTLSAATKRSSAALNLTPMQTQACTTFDTETAVYHAHDALWPTATAISVTVSLSNSGCVDSAYSP